MTQRWDITDKPAGAEQEARALLATLPTLQVVALVGNAISDSLGCARGLATLLSVLESRFHAGDAEAVEEAGLMAPVQPLVLEAKDTLLSALGSLARMGVNEPKEKPPGGG